MNNGAEQHLSYRNASSDSDSEQIKTAVEVSLRNKRQKRRGTRQSDPPISTALQQADLRPPLRQDPSLDLELPVIGDVSSSGTGADDSAGYLWATVVEHQRGFTLFSTPHYSTASLLPTDPPAFVGSAGGGGAISVETLEQYNLPSPKWHWVSKFWMVDMRGEGEVDSEGWEYSWSFGGKVWRSQAGYLNAGAWVRRRRWVRLMMMEGGEEGGRREDGGVLAVDEERVWRGESGDWERCMRAMRGYNVDGLKLELWRRWLEGGTAGEVERRRGWIGRVVGSDGVQLFGSLTYPQSRLRLLKLLSDAGLDPCVDPSLAASIRSEFASYGNL